MTAHINGPAWFYPGGNMERRPAAIAKVHTGVLVDLFMDDGSTEPMVPYFGMAGDPHDRHAYRPDAGDNVDVDAIRIARENRMRHPVQDAAPLNEPSDNGSDDGA